MGLVLSLCVRCATYTHDRYIGWRWNHDDYDLAEVSTFQPKYHSADCSTLFSAVVDRNENEIRRIASSNENACTEINSTGESPLHLACKLGYLHVVKTLIEVGCRPDICTNIGTAAHCCVKATQTGYLSQNEGARLLHHLADAGCDVSRSIDAGEKTTLFYAVELGSVACIHELLKLGVALNLRDQNGFTALYMAVIRGDLLSVSLLIQKLPQLDVNIPDNMGRTPLVSALISITNNFKYHGISNSNYNLNGFSVLKQVGEVYNRIAIVEALLRAGADPNVMDNHERTALVIAFVMLELDTIHKDNWLVPQSGEQKDQLSVASAASSSHSTEKESIYTPLVRLLVLSGAQFPVGWNKDYSKSPRWIQQLYNETKLARQQEMVQRPSRLVHLCRLAIRAYMACVGRLHQMSHVPVPTNLKGYLEVRYL